MIRLTLAILLVAVASCSRGRESSPPFDQKQPRSVASKSVEAEEKQRKGVAISPPSKAGLGPHDLSKGVITETLEGRFRSKIERSRVLFLEENAQIIHVWSEGGVERSEAVTTEIPPGERECKVLRSFDSQDFLLCLYWYTGPGGGRVDGLLFDLKRRIAGEFFSAAINTQLFSTLCYPDTMVGPMPAFWVESWDTAQATPKTPAKIVVELKREGWTTAEAAALRKVPVIKNACECLGANECPGEPQPPKAKRQLVFELSNDRLYPSAESEPILKEIAAQWGHSPDLKTWNLTMRGFGKDQDSP